MTTIFQDFWHIQLIYEDMADKYAAQPPQVRARLLRYDTYPDDEPPSDFARETFRRLWEKRDEFLRPHEIQGIKEAMRRDPSYRSCVKRAEWMAHMKYIRESEED